MRVSARAGDIRISARTRARVQHLEKQTVKDFLLTLFKQHLSALYLVLQK